MLTCTCISHARTMLVDCNQIASVTPSLSKTASHPSSLPLLYTLCPRLFSIGSCFLINSCQIFGNKWLLEKKKTGIFFFSLKKIDREMMKKEKERKKKYVLCSISWEFAFFCWLLTLLLLLKESKKKICNYNLIASSSYCVARQDEKT